MNDLSGLNYLDLNLILHMTIGTWRLNVELKKTSIKKSNLPESEKKRLEDLVDKIWQKAEQGKYENRKDGQPSIGMVGTGFYSFYSKDDGEAARIFIGLCIDILDIGDDEEIYRITEKRLSKELRGLKTASASAMLHCLKPETFPILNNNAGNKTIFEYFNIDLNKIRLLTTLVSNCRKIKEFRDSHFLVKNYRIYDLAARMVKQTSTNTSIDYIGILEYLENNRNIPYSDPSVEKDEEKKEQLLEIKAMGQSAINEIKRMTELCKDRFNLDKCEKLSWLDSSNIKTRDYLWAQMKYSAFADRPESISIFVDMSEVTDRPRYRYSLELKDDNSNKSFLDNYHKHLDISLPDDKSLCYVSGENKYGRPQPIYEDINTIRQKIESGELYKVQVCAITEWSDGYSNDDYENAMLSGVEKLIPFYEHVLGIEKDEYWPSKQQYDPGLSIEKWVEILQDPDTTRPETLQMLAMMLKLGGEATCARIAEVFGGSYGSYNSWGRSFGERVCRNYNCTACPDNGTDRYFPIPFVGRNVNEGGNRRYSWKIREELAKALEYIELPSLKDNIMSRDDKTIGLNTILYGPPGTGKTYNSVNFAVAICDGKTVDEVQMENYEDVLKRFNELRTKGRIAFTTFHQSYGYEEFIEGIKPITNDKTGDISYEIVDGIFKEFCNKNSKSLDVREMFDAAWEKMTDRSDENDIEYTFTRKSGTVINATYMNDNKFRVNWSGGTHNDLKKDAIFTQWSLPDITRDSYTGGNKWLYDAQEAVIIELKKNGLPEYEDHSAQPSVFIIDEINRGNISKIFGELITLIEDTKRTGEPEMMTVELPYSHSEFSVPNNVYILGTMNTADRSIALMDTALRRRFDFQKMMPDVKVLDSLGVGKIRDGQEELDVSEMLKIINSRIEFLYDREHTIGHAFFTKLKDDPSVKTLADIFKKKVIPLLQEYFYEDYEKIQLVLGDNDKDDSLKFILSETQEIQDLFNGKPDIDSLGKKYTIQEMAFDNIMSYKGIGKNL